MRCEPRLYGSVAREPNVIARALHTAAYEQLQVDGVFVALAAPTLERGLSWLQAADGAGATVGAPYKQAALAACTDASEAARSIGACNTLCIRGEEIVGHNTDWQGVTQALAVASVEHGPTVVVLGAGGAARAAAYALTMGSDREVFVAARRIELAKQLARDLGLAGALPLSRQGAVSADIVVDATSAQQPPWAFDATLYRSPGVLVDMDFRPSPAKAADARRRGWAIVEGWRILIHQATEQCALFHGKRPSLDALATAYFDITRTRGI